MVDKAAAIVAAALDLTRDKAWETLTTYTKGEALLRHALAVEASTAFYARKFGEDEELWRVTALLHDFDYEMHPTLDQHPQDGAPILRELGYPEVVIEGVLSHAEHLAMPRDTPLKKTLFACDELSGFVHACGLVRPTGLDGLEPKSVRKKLKQPSFAAGVHRDEVYAGAELARPRARRPHHERDHGAPADRARAGAAHCCGRVANSANQAKHALRGAVGSAARPPRHTRCLDHEKPRDRNGTLSVVFAASVVLALGPVGALLAIIFAIRSRRDLGYRSTKAWIGLTVGSIVLALFVLAILLIVLIAHSTLTF